MSSSSTTACSRSPSPVPTTPDAFDARSPEELSSWCKSLPSTEFLLSSGLQLAADHAIRKTEERPSLSLEDLLQAHAYEDATPAARDLSPESMFCPVVSPSSPAPSADYAPGHRSSISSLKPIPPPAPKASCSNLPILFPSLPDSGTKSRVETQIRLTVDLAHASASSGEPLKYDKVGSWKWLRLPKGTTTKKRTRKEGKVDAPLEECLYLTAEITCATPPHTRVTVCSSCQTREAKRVARKIAARVRPTRSDSESAEEPRVLPGQGKHEDTSNIIQFNCPEVLDFSSGSVVLPLRITCYCRHHREKIGFNLRFWMLDHTGRIVGTGTTKPIMITDDHKSTGVNTAKANTEFGSKLDWTVSGMEPQASAPKRRKAGGSERAKKRAKPYDSNSRLSRLQRQSSSGSLQSPSEMPSAFATRASSPQLHLPSQIITSVVSPSPSSYSVGDQPHSAYPDEPQPLLSPSYDLHEPLAHSPYAVQSVPPPLAHPYYGNEQPLQPTQGMMPDSLDSSASTAVASPLLSAYDSNPSMAEIMHSNFNMDVVMPDLEPPMPAFQDPSTSSYVQSPPEMAQQSAVEPMNLAMSHAPAPTLPLPYMLFKHDPPPPVTLPLPRIHRLIPAAGPTFGGIEVTVLGANFHSSMPLNCVFGSTASTSTQRWSDNTLVCILPPSVVAGQVHVWFEGLPKEEDGTPACLFTYTDETDRALMELALQVVGLKMTGKIEDARNIAMRIVGNTGGPDPNASMPTESAGGAMQLSARLLLGRAGESRDFEKTLLDFLALLDVPVGPDTNSSVLSKQTPSGQSLLHLAVLAKFPTLTRFLLSRHIDIDARDNNGCTALFLAALTSSAECAHVLVEAGAAMDVVNAAGKTPAEVGPAGFFDFITSESERSFGAPDSDSDDGAWADIDEQSEDDTELRNALRRRRVRRPFSRSTHPRSTPQTSTAPERVTPAPPPTECSVGDAPLPSPPAPSPPAEKAAPLPKSEKAALGAVVDEKEAAAAATFTDTLYRTLAQLQHPQDMIAQMQMQIPGLPLPALGLPTAAWGALPQVAAVFPVLVAIQQLWGARAEEKGKGVEGEGEGEGEGAQIRQDWKAFWEKWMLAASQQQQGRREHENPPPAYTPRHDNADSFPADTKCPEGPSAEPQSSIVEVDAPTVEVEKKEQREKAVAPRQARYAAAAVPEEEMQLYGYRKPARRAQKKHDRMLVLFWIPILIVGFGWACLHALRIALHATKTIVTLKVSTGLHA
ncbi:uncharacterized protein BXZ73DRAFT_88063 [Epithele typhae]|uniref:uncharacterized protein n=1 Tax=Epithele typhae TaxID=378194 RepID=UPI0020085BD2|nr:uncharacterized protein BXZ73DRAFT_88063 [Epithele typhae]KAH9942518.1 hypothetical protein BXZ73DRAFT_88063 [Epithele typhae]